MIIEKVINRQIYLWEWSKELYDKHFLDFIKIPICEHDKVKEFAKLIGLKKKKFEDGFDEDIIEELNWDFAVDCNSYDSTKPVLPLDTDDELHIFCKCKCPKCNYETKECYWDD